MGSGSSTPCRFKYLGDTIAEDKGFVLRTIEDSYNTAGLLDNKCSDIARETIYAGSKRSAGQRSLQF